MADQSQRKPSTVGASARSKSASSSGASPAAKVASGAQRTASGAPGRSGSKAAIQTSGRQSVKTPQLTDSAVGEHKPSARAKNASRGAAPTAKGNPTMYLMGAIGVAALAVVLIVVQSMFLSDMNKKADEPDWNENRPKEPVVQQPETPIGEDPWGGKPKANRDRDFKRAGQQTWAIETITSEDRIGEPTTIINEFLGRAKQDATVVDYRSKGSENVEGTELIYFEVTETDQLLGEARNKRLLEFAFTDIYDAEGNIDTSKGKMLVAMRTVSPAEPTYGKYMK